MNYKLRLEKIKTVKELFDFREELLESAERYSYLWDVEDNPTKSDNLRKCQDANFFLQRVNMQIEHFERHGLVLSSIMKPEQEVKEKLFTESEISTLQSAIHKITGDGEVMELFNQLLGN
jgi:hypothetical protein